MNPTRTLLLLIVCLLPPLACTADGGGADAPSDDPAATTVLRAPIELEQVPYPGDTGSVSYEGADFTVTAVALDPDAPADPRDGFDPEETEFRWERNLMTAATGTRVVAITDCAGARFLIEGPPEADFDELHAVAAGVMATTGCNQMVDALPNRCYGWSTDPPGCDTTGSSTTEAPRASG